MPSPRRHPSSALRHCPCCSSQTRQFWQLQQNAEWCRRQIAHLVWLMLATGCAFVALGNQTGQPWCQCSQWPSATAVADFRIAASLLARESRGNPAHGGGYVNVFQALSLVVGDKTAVTATSKSESPGSKPIQRQVRG